MNIMSSIEDQKKILLKVAQFKLYSETSSVNKKVIELILQGLDLNLKIPELTLLKERDNETNISDSLLHLAFKENNIDAYNILICKGADFNVKDKKGNTVLHEAFRIFYISYTVFKWNFEKTINTIHKKHLFIGSTLSAHVKYRNANNPAGSNGLTHFHIACATSNIEAVQFFLSSGVPVNQAVTDIGSENWFEGYTPLHFAAKFGCIKVILMLLTHGANVKLKSTKGKTPLHLCLERYIEIIDSAEQVLSPTDIEINNQIMFLLLNHSMSSIFSHLYVVSAMQNSIRVQSFLNQGADVNQSISMDSQVWPGYTALHFAARVNVNTVKLLLKHGANVEAKEANDITPFDMCIDRYKVEDIVEILYSVPSWKNIVLSDGQTKLIDLFFALRSSGAVKHFLKKSSGNVKLFVPFDSPLWPGFTVLHLAILVTERKKCRTEYKYNEETGVFNPDLTVITECLKQDADVTVKDRRNWTPVHFAFRLGKHKVVDLLLQHHHRISSCVDEENLSHLHVACAAKNRHLVEKFVWNEADVNVVYKGDSPISGVYPGWTPLHVAVLKRDGKIAKLLLKFGADIHATDAHGFTPIHVLMRYSALDLSQLLFGAQPISRDIVVEDMGLSYLHAACWSNSIDAVKQLLDVGADVNRATHRRSDSNEYFLELYDCNDCRGNTPLHCALADYNFFVTPQLVRLLLERGADMLVKNSSDASPLKEIIDTEVDDFIDAVIDALKSNAELRKRVETETGLTLLHLACFQPNADLIRELLDNGADVNAQIHENSEFWPKYTCLHVLLSRNDELPEEDDEVQDLTKLLLSRNADVTLSNAAKDTPLHLVYRELLIDEGDSYRPRINLLLKAHKNFEVNPTSTEGFSHFHIACHMLDADLVESFLEHGVDVNATVDLFCKNGYSDVAGCSPLHLAVRRMNSEDTDSTLLKPLAELFAQLKIVDLLIKHGADVNVEDVHGNTPAHYTASYSSLKEHPLKLLANGGANVNAVNVQGETPLELLLKKKNFTLDEIRYFIGCGCHFNAFNAVTDKGHIALADSTLSHDDMQLLLFGALLNSPNLMKVDSMNRTGMHNVVSVSVPETVYTQYVDLFDIFMKFGCDIDDQDDLGRTALHLAALFRNVSAVEGLFLAGADINITDRNGRTPFSYLFEPCSLCRDANAKNHQQYSHVKLFKAFICQIKKMELCDVYVNESDKIVVNEALARFESGDIANYLENIYPEIEQMKNLKIEPYSLTPLDFMSKASAVIDYPTMPQFKRGIIDAFFRTNKKLFQIQFQTTASIFLLQYRQAVLRRKIINEAKDSMSVLMRLRLPDVCSHIILRFLKNFELKNLISSTA